MSRNKLCIIVGSITLLSSIMYILSDIIELLGGGFSATQLHLTYAAFLFIPFFLIGLYTLQLPRAGGLGLAGAATYGISSSSMPVQQFTHLQPRRVAMKSL